MEANEFSLEKMLMARAAQQYRPINGSIELLPLCNMNCRMCYVRLSRLEMDQMGSLLPLEDWMRITEEMQKAGVVFMLLTGGEPLLYPGFRELYLKLQELGMILTVNTNGTLIDEEWAAFFGAHRPRRINITLYGASEKTYRKLCRFEGYEKTVRAIKLLRAHGVDVKINGSVVKENVHDMEAIYALGRSLDVPVHMDTYMLPGLHDRLRPIEEQSRLLPEDAAWAELQTMKNEYPAKVFEEYRQRKCKELQEPLSSPCNISCMAAHCSFTVNWQGHMKPCVMQPEPAVSVFEHGFEAAWKQIVDGAKPLCFNEKCGSCAYRPVCKICVSAALLETGAYDGVPEYLCRQAKAYARLLEEEQDKNGSETK